MNGKTNVQIVGAAGALAMLGMWLLGYALPDLMATAPPGAEAAFTVLLTVLAGLIFKHDAGVKSLPGTGEDPNRIRSPWLVGVLAVLLAFSALEGCGTNRPQVDSVADAIAVTAADVETAAETVHYLCGNTQPGGPCGAGAVISTSAKDGLKERLQQVLDGLTAANDALALDDSFDADNKLGRAAALLSVLQAELVRYQN